MEKAYLKASANGELPANARQIFYAARTLVQGLLGPGVELKDKYFTQTLLPDFVADNPDLTSGWDVVYDARDHLLEPHTGVSIPVGTTQVRDYLLPRRHRPADLVAVDAALHPTLGPENRFKTLLYIEKEGFEPLLRKAEIPERFDCAVMSSKGTSVTAARLLVDRMAQQGVRGCWWRTTSTARAPASPGRWATTRGATASRRRPTSSTSACASTRRRPWACRTRPRPTPARARRSCAGTAWARPRSGSWSVATGASS
jgi:hypothetical protein